MAVYTEISDDDLIRFLAKYSIGELMSYKGIAEGVENSNYLVHTDNGSYILTLYEKRVSEADLPFFLTLMEHLAAAGISCPLPVHDRDGNVLQKLSGRPAAVISFLEGFSVKRPKSHHCAAVGEGLARLHLAGADFAMTRANSLSQSGWRDLFDKCNNKVNSIQDGLETLIADELNHLEQVWPQNLPSGIIHADLFPDNVFFLNDELSGLIDFYFACRDMLAYDLAICLNAWCFEPDNSFNITKGRFLLQGYNKVRPLDGDEIAALPVLARGAALRFLLTRVYDWLHVSEGAFVNPKDPREYVRKLRFHQQIDGADNYGLDGKT